MTLKDKFYKLFTSNTDVYPLDESVKIADDYAIEFAEWIDREGYIRQPNLWISLDEKIGKKSKEILEIFKKEKEL